MKQKIRRLLICVLPLALSSTFPIQPSPTNLWMALPTFGFPLINWQLIKFCKHVVIRKSYFDNFSITFPSPRWFWIVSIWQLKLTIYFPLKVRLLKFWTNIFKSNVCSWQKNKRDMIPSTRVHDSRQCKQLGTYQKMVPMQSFSEGSTGMAGEFIFGLFIKIDTFNGSWQ